MLKEQSSSSTNVSETLVSSALFQKCYKYITLLILFGDTMSDESETLKYPLPDSKKPLKVDGSAIEYIVLFPKGYKEYPEKEIEQEEIDRLQDEISRLKKELEALTEERDTLSQKLSEIEKREKEELIQDVSAIKEKLGITEEGENPLSDLPLETLRAIIATLSKIPIPDEEREDEAEPKVPPEKPVPEEKKLSAEEKFRLELYGHKEEI